MAWDPGGFPHNWDPFFRGDVSWMGCPAGDQAGFQDIPRHIGDYSDGPELPGMAHHGLGKSMFCFSMNNIEIFQNHDTSHDNLENI